MKFIDDFPFIIFLLLFVIFIFSFALISFFNLSIEEKVIENKDTFNIYHICYKLNDVYYCKWKGVIKCMK